MQEVIGGGENLYEGYRGEGTGVGGKTFRQQCRDDVCEWREERKEDRQEEPWAAMQP